MHQGDFCLIFVCPEQDWSLIKKCMGDLVKQGKVNLESEILLQCTIVLDSIRFQLTTVTKFMKTARRHERERGITICFDFCVAKTRLECHREVHGRTRQARKSESCCSIRDMTARHGERTRGKIFSGRRTTSPPTDTWIECPSR